MANQQKKLRRSNSKNVRNKTSKKAAPAKKKRRRDVARNSGLQKKYFSKIKQEYHDIDYADKLSDKDKEWLNRFMEEDLGARMNHGGKKIYRSGQARKESYRRNNQRNRDMYSILKASGMLDLQDTQGAIEKVQEKHINENSVEDTMLDFIDKKRLLKK